MNHTRREHLFYLGALATAAAVPSVAAANEEPKTILVEMLNKHPDNKKERQVFYPDIVRANVGDTIKFVATDRGHNSATTDKNIPEGASAWKGKIGEEIEITLDTPGAYGYFCTPHRTAGMVGLLLVGDVSSNYEDLKGARYRGKEKKRYEDIFARADEMLAQEQSS